MYIYIHIYIYICLYKQEELFKEEIQTNQFTTQIDKYLRTQFKKWLNQQ